jgi:hypothetical protein
MGRKPNEYTVKLTHTYVHNPEAVERGLALWAAYLAGHLRRRLNAEEGKRRSDTP